jgi:hypothetical protein
VLTRCHVARTAKASSLAICRGRGKACCRSHLRQFRSLGSFSRRVAGRTPTASSRSRDNFLPLPHCRPSGRPARAAAPLGARRARVDRRRELDDVSSGPLLVGRRRLHRLAFAIMTASVIDPVELVNATRLDHRNATGSCGLVGSVISRITGRRHLSVSQPRVPFPIAELIWQHTG